MTYAKLTRDNLAKNIEKKASKKKKKKKINRIHCKSELEDGGWRSTKKVYYTESVCI